MHCSGGNSSGRLAGTLAVMRIMDAFSCTDPTVCLSDLLEGILLEEIKGERHA
jgi:hypothetical protein